MGAATLVSATAVIGRLHVLTDESSPPRRSHVELAALLGRAGVDVVQYREKRDVPTAQRLATAERMLAELGGRGTRLIVDDRVDVALASGAAGVHLGADDMEPRQARRLLGPAALIGVTANDPTTARRLAREPVDYLGVGPVFGTRSKAGAAPPLGLDTLRAIVGAVARPVIAIGNIRPDNVAAVLATGVHGIAVLSAVVGAADPRRVVRSLRELLATRQGAETP